MECDIPHTILTLTSQVDYKKQIEILKNAFSLVFDWANDAGLKGEKVSGFSIREDDPSIGPEYGKTFLWCRIECTKEEREEWEKSR